MNERDNRPDVPTCQRCGCCELEWDECEECGGDGGTGQSNCIDDICNGGEVPCMHGDDAEYSCGTCDGKGGFARCSCDERGKHYKPAEEKAARQEDAWDDRPGRGLAHK